MQPILTAIPTLAVATVYCFWQVYELAQRQQAFRQRRLRERVTWMLWEMANRISDSEAAAPGEAAPAVQ